MTADKIQNVAYESENDSRHGYQALIFDLDGTLWDSCQSCAWGWNKEVHKLGITFRAIQADEIRSVAGLPHADCIAQIFAGLTVEQQRELEQATAHTDLDAIRQRGAQLYPGMATGLRHLAQRWPLYLVSNCQAGYIDLFWEMTGLGDLFRDSLCWGQTGQAKSDNLRTLSLRQGLSQALYIGDTQGDAEAAQAAGMDFWLANWGFGSAQADTPAFNSFAELVQALDRCPCVD